MLNGARPGSAAGRGSAGSSGRTGRGDADHERPDPAWAAPQVLAPAENRWRICPSGHCHDEAQRTVANR